MLLQKRSTITQSSEVRKLGRLDGSSDSDLAPDEGGRAEVVVFKTKEPVTRVVD